MSSTDDKNKRNKRLEKDENTIQKRLKLVKNIFWWPSNFFDEKKHMLAKHKPGNCGNPKCVMCGNPRKFFKGSEALTLQENRLFQDLDKVRDKKSNGNKPDDLT